MSTHPSNEPNASTEVPQVSPKSIGYGHPEFHFVQSVMELQKSMIELTASVNATKSTVDGLKSKVDDLVKWKTMIIGGAITLGFLLGLGLAIAKSLDNVSIAFGAPPLKQAPPEPSQK